MRPAGREDGAALLVALLAMLLLGALGSAIALTTLTEAAIAGNYVRAEQSRAAAEAVLERALAALAAEPDWSPVLAGAARSSFVDGPPTGVRVLRDGTRVDLAAVVNAANCQRPVGCGALDLVAITPARPWGANNPVWQPYAYGFLSSMVPATGPGSDEYVLALVADDPAENDGDPLADGADETNPGAGILELRAEAFGLRGAHRIVRATVARGNTTVRIVSWRTQPRAF